MLIKDHWYVACPASKLEEGLPFPFEVGNFRLVAFRDEKGEAVVLRDRCCHRGVPLSLGRVQPSLAGTGKCVLSCRYHGWEYDSEGKVVFIPAHKEPGQGDKFSAQKFHAVEAEHYVWVWIPGCSDEPTYQPRLRGFGDGFWAQQTTIWDVNIVAAVENNLDASHTPFSHAGDYPGRRTDNNQIPSLHEGVLRLAYNNETVAVWSPRLQEEMPTFDEEIIFGMLMEMPYRNYVFLDKENTKAIYNWIPLSDNKCRLEFMFQGDFVENMIGIRESHSTKSGKTVRILDEEFVITKQDRVLLEPAQAYEWGQGYTKSEFMSVKSDTPQLMARKLMIRAIEASENDEVVKPVPTKTQDFHLFF